MNSLKSYHSLSFKKRLIEELVIKSWWVYAFILLNIIGFSFGFKQLDAKAHELSVSITMMQNAKLLQEKRQEDLFFKLKSLEDPKSVEMILKKELGMVPEGQKKIYFSEQH